MKSTNKVRIIANDLVMMKADDETNLSFKRSSNDNDKLGMTVHILDRVSEMHGINRKFHYTYPNVTEIIIEDGFVRLIANKVTKDGTLIQEPMFTTRNMIFLEEIKITRNVAFCAPTPLVSRIDLLDR